MKMREALISMCYREVKPGVWAKPVGFHLFTFEEDRNEWTNWYKAGTGEIDRYEAKEPDLEEGTAISFLKGYEAYTRTNITVGHLPISEFELGQTQTAVEDEQYNCASALRTTISTLTERVQILEETLENTVAIAESAAVRCSYYGQDSSWCDGGDPLTHEAHSDAHDACHVSLEIADAIRALTDAKGKESE